MAAASPAFSVSSPSLTSPLATCSQALRPGRQGMDRLHFGIQLRRPDFRILHQPDFIGRADRDAAMRAKWLAMALGIDRLLLIARRDAASWTA